MPEIDAIDNAKPIGYADAQIRRSGSAALKATNGSGGEAQFSAKQITADNDFQIGGVMDMRTASNGVGSLSASWIWRWSDNAGSFNGTMDLSIGRAAAGLFFLLNPTGGGAGIEFTEMTAPSAGSANTARLFCRDNGSGKSQLCAIFATGAIQVIATEP